MTDAAEAPDPQLPPITSLSAAQRRVLGTMIEKALTVPESYPLTLKALTTGCNQKSARHPLTNYTEDDVEETLGQLRELGLDIDATKANGEDVYILKSLEIDINKIRSIVRNNVEKDKKLPADERRRYLEAVDD